MKSKKIKLDNKIPISERPYFVSVDNEKSNYKIERNKNYNYYESLSRITQDQQITKALVVDNYFDTEFLSKIKKESLRYPVNNKLGE